MKHNLFIKLMVLSCISILFSCKKYGYDIPNGYPDDSKNVATGTIDTNMRLIDKSLYTKARVFPGLVDPSEPRVKDAKFTLDLNFTDQTAQNLRIAVAPQPQFSTGYYAAPGELIKIVVPAGIEGLSVQIGGHTDNLAGLSVQLRDPLIYMRQLLYSGVNYVRNLYGGTIYILATRAYPNPVEFTITNAVVSPDFILGVSNDAAWVAQVKASQVPWLELRSKRVIFLVPRDKIIATFTSAEPYTNPTVALGKWNDVFDLDYNAWMGLSDNAPDPRDRSPQGPWRGALDIQLSEGYGHSGFPFMATNDNYWFTSFTSLNSIQTSSGQWGTYHEFGHNMQQADIWSWEALREVSNNMFSFKVAHRIGADFTPLHPSPPVEFPKAIAYAKSTKVNKNFDADEEMNDYFRRLTPFVQIMEKIGYGAITYVYTQARHAPRLNTSDISKHNFLYENLSDYAQKDLSPFFYAWGISVSPSVMARVASKGYPVLDKAIWEYNPLTKQGGNGPAFTTGLVSVSSEQVGDGNKNNLVDGIISPASYWHSKYSNPSAAETFPISIVLSTGSPTPVPIKGVLIAQRQASSAGRAKDVDIYTSTDNVNYTKVASTTVPQSDTPYNFLFPGGAVSARYVKVVILNGRNAVYTNLSECNLIRQ